jgi:hypothetical protein
MAKIDMFTYSGTMKELMKRLDQRIDNLLQAEYEATVLYKEHDNAKAIRTILYGKEVS